MNRCNPCRCPHKRFTEITNRCDPCKCLPKITQPVKSHYFYVEKGPSPINSKSKPINSVPERQPRSRPSSASSVKPRSRPSSASTVPSGGSKRSLGGTSKVTSSDSKILKKKTPIKTKISSPLKNREERKSKIDEESVKQLKEDLKTIKDQLSILTKSRNEALDVTNELEKRYTNLLNKSESQEKEIEELKRINRSLQEALNRQTSSSSSSNIELKNAKVCLQQYEQQLTALYKELMTTSKAMEESRDKVCQCIKEKQNEYNEMVHSNKELSKVVEEKNSKYENLLEQFQTAKNKEVKYRKQNEELLQTIEELENQLSEATMELEASREETAITAKQLQEEMMDKTKCYTYELQLKAKEIEELNEAVEHLRKHICQCKTTNNKQMEAKYEQLLQKYNCAMEQLKFYERNCKCRSEEMEMQKKNEKNLVDEMVKLKALVEKLSQTNQKSCVKISKLTNLNEEKDSIIKCQNADLTSKNKKIELLKKNEDRLKKRVVQLQEDLVSMKISPHGNVLSTEDCDPCLTEELQDLITALYEEIDKSLGKDTQIQQQNHTICHLRCTLQSKEKLLICAHNELKILKEQFQTTLNEKRALAEQLQKTQSGIQYSDSSGENYIEEQEY